MRLFYGLAGTSSKSLVDKVIVGCGILFCLVRPNPLSAGGVAGNTGIGNILYPAGGMVQASEIHFAGPEYDFHCALLDAKGGYMYLARTGSNTSGPIVFVKVRLSNFSRVGALTLNYEENRVAIGGAAIDPAGEFAYIGTDSDPAAVIKIRLSDMKRVATMTLPAGEKFLKRAIIDRDGNYLYLGTGTAPGRVIKIRLWDFARVGAVTLNPGEDMLASGIIDPSGEFAYFGTCAEQAAGVVVKVRLDNMTRAGSLTLASDEKKLACAVIDPGGQYAYFGTGTVPGKVVAVHLPGLTRVASVSLEMGSLVNALIDPAGRYAYFQSAVSMTKVQIADLAILGHYDFEEWDGEYYCGAVDPSGAFAYFANFSVKDRGGIPGKVTKIDVSDMTVGGELNLHMGENCIAGAVIDRTGKFGYFGGDGYTGKIIKMRLLDFTCQGIMGFDLDHTEILGGFIDPKNEYLYAHTGSKGMVMKIRLEDFTEVGRLYCGEFGPMASCVMDPEGIFGYFGTETHNIVKVRLAHMAYAGAITAMNEYEFRSAMIDPAGAYAYFTAFENEPSIVYKVRLSDFKPVGSLYLGKWTHVRSIGIRPQGDYAYFITEAKPTLIKVRLSDFAIVGAHALNAGAGAVCTGAGSIDSSGCHAYTCISDGTSKIYKIGLPDMTELGQFAVNTGDLISSVIDAAGEYAYFGTSELPGRIVKVALSQKNSIHANKITLEAKAQLKDVRFYSHAAGGGIRLAIYDDNSPRKVVWQSWPVFVAGAGSWVVAPIAKGVPGLLTLAPGTYWLAWQTDMTSDAASYGLGAVGEEFSFSNPYGAFPGIIDPETATPGSARWSVYLTYNLDSAGEWLLYD